MSYPPTPQFDSLPEAVAHLTRIAAASPYTLTQMLELIARGTGLPLPHFAEIEHAGAAFRVAFSHVVTSDTLLRALTVWNADGHDYPDHQAALELARAFLGSGFFPIPLAPENGFFTESLKFGTISPR